MKSEYETKAVDGISRKLKSIGKVENELYHLPSDPEQKNNIFAERRHIAQKLYHKFFDFLEENDMPEESLRWWQSL